MISTAHIHAQGCAVEVRLNDIPVGKIESQKSNDNRQTSLGAAMYLVNGTNALNMTVTKINDTQRVSAQAWVSNTKPGEFAGGDPHKSPNVLMLAEWRPETAEEKAPKTIEVRKDLGGEFGQRLWEKAAPLALDDATREKARVFLEAVRIAYVKGDGDAMVVYMHPKLVESSQAMPGRSEDMLEQQIKKMAQGLAASPDFKMAPLDPAQFDFQLAAGGRLLICVNKDGKPTLRPAASKPGMSISFPMTIGLDNGEFRVFL